VECIGREPDIVLDAAHNGASVQALLQALDDHFRPGPRILLFAASGDKELATMLRQLVPRFSSIVMTRFQGNPRGADPQRLRMLAVQQFPEREADVECVENPAEAWDQVRRRLTRQHLLCVTGSFFLAAEVLTAMEQGKALVEPR